MGKFKFPTAYTILFGLIVVMAALTWVLPAGQYEMVDNEDLGRQVPVSGSYHEVDPNPQGLTDIFMAPIAGFYDPGSYEASAIDVALFVLFIGGFLGIVTKTGAIDTGIAKVTTSLKGKEIMLIPILMILFAAGGTIYGMAEETLAFYALIIPVIIAAGYDSVTAVAIIMLGAGIGTLGSTINPFATVIASQAAGIPFTEGLSYRLFILVAGLVIGILYVMRYAKMVKNDPSKSLVAEMAESNKKHFLTTDSSISDNLTGTQNIILLIFSGTFALLVYGVSVLGWWMAEMSALFLASSILVAIVARMGEEEFSNTFVEGARELLGVALVIGLARGIVVIMDSGNLTGTILYASEGMVSGLSEIGFINAMFGVQILLSFFVPSSSGLAVLSMPVMAPLAEFSGVASHLAVTAFQSASGLVNLVNPTFAVVMGGLAIGRVPYNKWLSFTWPLLLILAVLIMGTLTVGTIV
ncbi:C4-dicarboxylate ABC transporter [Oleiphilus sp. HI0009]|uniref:YfcC family protein n=1 Tax=unclassified Oleiphilus TaxID=2631174 RepID=UPI0007C3447C|nr:MULTISPECIES: YfcC family protein [unclassified Oleiphilus]KZX76631.1 C4-dicarboxylate ABC transporter [Oleiphilus sp. HI0009]KZY61583.1 C4-dicarboxylate ABC transporter [Oleiphilus sp. HI0066]KZY77243.1 C4-dicarboxylate ABC transporter [Oleiphilus sp. HI0067]